MLLLSVPFWRVSQGLEPSSVTTEPMYLKLVTCFMVHAGKADILRTKPLGTFEVEITMSAGVTTRFTREGLIWHV